MEEMLISLFVERYLDEARSFYRSFATLKTTLKHLAENFGDMRLVDLRPHHIHDYVHKRLRLGLKASSINHELALIRSAINYVRTHWDIQLEKNPISRHRLKTSPLRLRYLTPSEARALVQSANSDALRSFLTLALHTGCRKSELMTLQWSDIDINRRVLVLKAENTKGNKARSIPLNQNALDAINVLSKSNKVGSEWVFCHRSGKRRRSFGWSFEKACNSAGIEDFHIHDLRHTFASWLVSNGVDLIKVRDLLGHTSIKMTERYAHLMPSRLLSAVEVLDDL